jgi:hypothetical protein
MANKGVAGYPVGGLNRTTQMHATFALARMRPWMGSVLGALLLAAAIVPSAPARAQDDRAADLERQVRAWLADLLGPRADLADRPVRITAEGDHFRVTIPTELFAPATATVTAGPITAVATPLPGGRWAFDQIALPSPLRVSYSAGGGGPTTLTTETDEQAGHAVLDPSFTTASTWDSTIKGYATRVEAPQGGRSTRIGQLVSHLSWQPAEGGRINVLQEMAGTRLAGMSLAPKIGVVSFSADRFTGSVHVDNLTPELLPPVVRAVIDLAPIAMDAAAEARRERDAKSGQPLPAYLRRPKLTDAARVSLRDAIVALRDLTTGFSEQGTLENLRVEEAGQTMRASRISAGLAMGAPAGLLRLRLTFASDGLDSSAIPQGVLHDYLPRHIALATRVGGVSGKALTDLLLRAIDSDGRDPTLDLRMRALLRQGPVTVGLDELAVDAGPVSLKGSGEILMVDRDAYSGHARFEATGIDAMIRESSTTPALRQATPFLILLKGFGQQDGDKLVWDVVYEDGKFLVNGNDLSQMIPRR